MSAERATTGASGVLPGWFGDALQLFNKKNRLIRKVAARKRSRAAAARVYTDSPVMSLVIQSFNHRDNIEPIVGRLRQTVADELIVCEDGSVDGSEKAWRRLLTRPNDLLVQSNDLHEIRTYNRAISLARGEFVCVLQDDDIPPANPGWVADAIVLFRTYPKLAILGCWNGWAFDFGDFETSIGSPVGPGVHGADSDVSFVDQKSTLPFQFVEAVGIGPMFFRRADFLELGGFDLRLSGPGEPGIWLDYDICLRAWCAGRQVGAFESDPFDRHVGGQGTMMFAGSKLYDNYRRNLKHVERTFAHKSHSIRRMVDELNGGLAPRLKRPSRAHAGEPLCG